MRLLFVHQNFPGQFKHLAPALAVDPANEVVAFTMQKNVPASWQGVRLIGYQATRGATPNVHPLASDFETKMICGEAAFRAALVLRESGFTPDVIVTHPGWGESLFLKDVWPAAKLGIYCEFFYHANGAEAGFDPKLPVMDPGEVCRLRLKNLNNLLHFEIADQGISPTHWQASTFPEPFHSRITVIHDGIDCDAVAPNPVVSMSLNGGIALTKADEVTTMEILLDADIWNVYLIYTRNEQSEKRKGGVGYGTTHCPHTEVEHKGNRQIFEGCRNGIEKYRWLYPHP